MLSETFSNSESLSQTNQNSNQNSLLNIINSIETDDKEPNIFQHSPYYENNALTDILKPKQNIFKILGLNCQSLPAKYDQLKIYIESLQEQDCSFDTICLQESWLGQEDDLSVFNLDSYNMISSNKKISLHGGLVMYIHKKHSFTKLEHISTGFTDWECQCIRVKSKNKSNNDFIIANIYRLPKQKKENYETFNHEFSELFHNLEKISRDIILCGDFNIDLLKLKVVPNINEFFDNMLAFGLIPKITLPTRFSTKSSTLIDNVFCKLTKNFSETTAGVITYNLSDHLPYFVTLDYLSTKETKKNYVTIQKYDEENIEKCISDFKSSSIHIEIDELSDPNDCVIKLQDVIIDMKNKYFPIRKINFNKYKHKKQRWMTQGILHSIKFRDKLYAKMRNCPTESIKYQNLRKNLQTYNRILKTNIRIAKLSYYHTLFENCKNDIKTTWSNISDLINRKNGINELPQYMIKHNIKYENQKMIADLFNDYFNKMGLSQTADPDDYENNKFLDYFTDTTIKSFEFQLVTEESVDRIINKLAPKNSTGEDGISVKFLKNIKQSLVPTLTKIINKMILSGIYPDKLKIAKVVPVYKKGDQYNIENYRPISLLPALSKVFEHAMLEQLDNHFTSNHLYFPGQYGFRKKHSTELAVMENVDRIIENLENGKLSLNIYIDLSKAFDSIDHTILLSKLHKYGIHGKAYQLCQSYFQNRSQYVKYNNFNSNSLIIKTGVPQGSILGPFFFLVYINDFNRCTSFFNVTIYADDTTLQTHLEKIKTGNEHSTEMYINDELTHITTWLKANKLSLNIDKTRFMIFQPSKRHVPELKLKIENKEIKQVKEFDFLGISVDENLSWKSHIDKIGFKIKKVLAIMNRLKKYLPSETLLIIYNSLFLSHLKYMCMG